MLKSIISVIFAIALFTVHAHAQEAPANWGQLAVSICDSLGHRDLSQEEAARLLETYGVSLQAYLFVFGLGDGLGEDQWPFYRELTTDFLCQLHMAAHAAAYVGNVPGYEPLSDVDTDREDAGRSFVRLIIVLAQRDAECQASAGPEPIPGGGEPCFTRVCHTETRLVCERCYPGPKCRWVDVEVCEEVPCQ